MQAATASRPRFGSAGPADAALDFEKRQRAAQLQQAADSAMRTAEGERAAGGAGVSLRREQKAKAAGIDERHSTEVDDRLSRAGGCLCERVVGDATGGDIQFTRQADCCAGIGTRDVVPEIVNSR